VPAALPASVSEGRGQAEAGNAGWQADLMVSLAKRSGEGLAGPAELG
jgi:hypothetical protein